MSRFTQAVVAGLLTGGMGLFVTLLPFGLQLEEDVGLAFLFKMRGTRRPPMMKISAGGTVLIIVILSSHYEGPQDIFRGYNKGHAGYEAEHGIEFEPPFPRKMGMFVDKELNDEQKSK